MVWKVLPEIIWSLFLLQDLDLIIQNITKLSLNFFPARRFHRFFEQSFPKFRCSYWIFFPLYSSVLSPAATCAHYLCFVKIRPNGKSSSAFSMCTFFLGSEVTTISSEPFLLQLSSWNFSSYEKFSNSLIILVALPWTLSSFSVFLLKCWGNQNWTHHSGNDITCWIEYRNHIPWPAVV